MIKLNCSMSIESDLLNYKNDDNLKLSQLDVLLNSINNLPEDFFKEYYDYLKLFDEFCCSFIDKEEYDYLKSKCDNLYILLNEKYNFNPYFNLLDFDYIEIPNSKSSYCKGIYCQSIPLYELFNVHNGCYDGWYSLENGLYYFNVLCFDEILKHDITKIYLNNDVVELEISFYNEEHFLKVLKNICESKYGKISIPY